VEDYDLLVCWNVDDDINGDGGVLGYSGLQNGNNSKGRRFPGDGRSGV
jgi:hypothetical protein